MSDEELLQRVVCDPKVMTGKPVVRGTRLTVEYVLKLLSQGWGLSDILGEYEGLVPEDIQACLLFASKSLSNTSFMPLISESV
ncbi:MAG: DUF433 domain-containing protein [Pirellulaceae bacterium]|nr:DUF433 domain-containing protein [Pirellulaceae bacterium]